MKKLEEYVRSIPDFPEPGIIFRDVTSILQDADGLQLAIDSIQEKLNEFAILEVTTTLAVVMNGLIEDDLRLVLVREFRQLTNEQNIDEDRRSPFRVSRATGNVNDRSVDAALQIGRASCRERV